MAHDTHLAQTPEARRVLASPIRLEILGHFVEPGGMSIARIAGRMGRAASSLYYHVHLLEEAGLLRRVGTRRAGKRDEILYEPAADRIGLATEADDERGVEDARRVVAAAFRMARSDFDEAVTSGDVVVEGPERNLHVTRLHFRLTPGALAKVNRHLEAIEKLVTREITRRRVPEDADRYLSLTLALLPLRGRGVSGDTP